MTEREFPDETADEPLGQVEAGESAIEPRILRVLRILTGRDRGIRTIALIVDRLRPSVGRKEIQSPREPFFQLRLKTVVGRVRAVGKLADFAQRGSIRLPLGGGRRAGRGRG